LIYNQACAIIVDRGEGTMKRTLILAVLAIISVAAPVSAQSQEGSVAIAASIRNQGDDATLGGYAACVAKLKQAGASVKEANAECQKAMRIMSDASKRIANEAADATKASRQVCCGYGYRRSSNRYAGYDGYYGGNAYNLGRQQSIAEEQRLRELRVAQEERQRAEAIAAREKERAEAVEAREKARAAAVDAREKAREEAVARKEEERRRLLREEELRRKEEKLKRREEELKKAGEKK
jgi:hypothetical protein